MSLKWRYRRTIAAFLGLALVLVAAALTPALRRNSSSLNLMFSPPDLYSPMAATDIDLSQDSRSFSIKFQNKYPGLHWLAIEVERPRTTVEGYVSNIVLNLEISSSNAILVKETITGLGNPFWSENRGGYALHWYRSPRDLPLGQPLSVTVTVVHGDSTFQQQHGWSKLVVKKLSDE